MVCVCVILFCGFFTYALHVHVHVKSWNQWLKEETPRFFTISLRVYHVQCTHFEHHLIDPSHMTLETDKAFPITINGRIVLVRI